MRIALPQIFMICIHFVLAVNISSGFGKNSADPTWVLTSPETISNANSSFLSGTLISHENKLYIIRNGKIAFSSDYGSSWTAIGPKIPTSYYNSAILSSVSFVIKGESFFISGFDGIIRSSATETTWTSVKSGLPIVNGTTTVRTLAISGSTLLAGTMGGAFATYNNGSTWVSVSEGIPDTAIDKSFTIEVARINVVGTTLFAANNRGDSFRGTPKGAGWIWTVEGMRFPTSVVAQGKYYFAASIGIGNITGSTLARSKDEGLAWEGANSGLPSRDLPRSLAVIGGNLFVVVNVSPTNEPGSTGHGEVYRSIDSGSNWSIYNSGFPTGNGSTIQSLVTIGENLFASTSSEGVWRLSVSPSKIKPKPFLEKSPGGRILFREGNKSGIVTYKLHTNGVVNLNLYSLSGERVTQIANGYQLMGSHTAAFDTSKLKGIYILKLFTSEMEDGQKIWIR